MNPEFQFDWGDDGGGSGGSGLDTAAASWSLQRAIAQVGRHMGNRDEMRAGLALLGLRSIECAADRVMRSDCHLRPTEAKGSAAVYP